MNGCKSRLLASLMMVVATIASAQQGRVDELRRELGQHPAQDREHVQLLTDLAEAYEFVDPFKADTLIEQAIRLARELKVASGIARALLIRVEVNEQLRHPDAPAIAKLEEAERLFAVSRDRVGRAVALAMLAGYGAKEQWGHVEGLFHQADSLLAADPQDKARGLVLLARCRHAILTDRPDDLLKYGEQARILFERIGEEARMISAIGMCAMAHMNAGRSERALELFVECAHRDSVAGMLYYQGNDLAMLGLLYGNMGNGSKAVEYDIRAMRIAEQMNDDNSLAALLINSAIVFGTMGSRDEAIANYQRGFELCMKAGYKSWANQALINWGELLLREQQFDLAMEKFQKAITLLDTTDTYDLAYAHQGLGAALMGKGAHGEAIIHLRMALGMYGGIEGVLRKGLCRLDLAKALREADATMLQQAELAPGSKNEMVAAELDSALAIGTRNGYLELQRDALEELSATAEDQGRQLEALGYLKRYMVVKDSVLSAEKAKAVANLQIQYETEKKEQQIVLLGKDKEVQAKEIQKQKLVRNGFVGGFALVALFAGVFLFQRNRIGKEKKRSEELLLNILPAEVAEELKAKGEAEAKLINEVTVLFTDFKGYTQMSEKLTAKELVADIHECFSAFDHIMEKHGIEKIKTIGDAYMAAGGLPTPNTTHALDVVKAALEIRDFIAEGKARKVAAGLPYFEIRIGIHTGPVVAGIVGVKKFQYDIWGDTVNTASRMESSGEVGQVNISEATYALVNNEPELTFTSRGKVQAKGKGEMEMYFVKVV